MTRTTPLLVYFLFGTLLSALSSSAGYCADPAVILITLDGVRNGDIRREWRSPNLLKNTIKYTRENGIPFGQSIFNRMKVSNPVALSLPGYRSILTGQYERSCRSNNCNRIRRPTLFDQLGDLGIRREDSLFLASWHRMDRAISESTDPIPGSVSLGPIYHRGPADETSTLEKIQDQARLDVPSWKSRLDKYTQAMALETLSHVEPRLTYLSFLDTDEWAHLGKKAKVYAALKDFDLFFQKLLSLLAQTPGRLERTSIIVTTDHGRGFLFLWKDHNNLLPGSKRIFAWVIPSKDLKARYRVSRVSPGTAYQSQIRATVEELLDPMRSLWKDTRSSPPLIRFSKL